MVSHSNRALTAVQIGKESTRGTAVAATRRLVVTDASINRMRPQENFEGEMNGVLARAVHAPEVTRHGAEFEFTYHLDFEQVLGALLSGMKGGVSSTQPGSGDAELWTFDPGNGDPAPDTYTVEYKIANGVGDALTFEAPYGFTTQIEIQGGEEGLPTITQTVVARRSSQTTATGGISLPTRTFAANGRWSMYVDDAWSGMGGSQITGHVIGFTWTFQNHLMPEYFQDGRTNLDFSNYIFMPGRFVDLSVDIAVDPDSAAFIPEELTHRDNGDIRAVRLELVGPAFASPDDGLNHFIRLDGAYYHAEDSMAEFGEERNGIMTTNLHLLSAYESVEGQDIEVAVQNTLDAFP